MDVQLPVAPTRRPRFRRASEPLAFRPTDDDVVIVRQLARHRFLRSTHIAALVGRSLGSFMPATSTDQYRMQSMKEALRQLHIPRSPGASLFLFATRDELRTSDPLTHVWHGGNSRDVGLV
jgi:hypothetical protein